MSLMSYHMLAGCELICYMEYIYILGGGELWRELFCKGRQSTNTSEYQSF